MNERPHDSTDLKEYYKTLSTKIQFLRPYLRISIQLVPQIAEQQAMEQEMKFLLNKTHLRYTPGISLYLPISAARGYVS